MLSCCHQSRCPQTQFVLDTLEQALYERRPARIEPSVGSVGDSYDNALVETSIGLFKAEVIHRLGPWKTADAVEWETLKWVDWFNNRRLL